MILYAARPGRRMRQVTADVLTAIWIAGWWVAATAARAAVLLLADPSRAMAGAALRIRDGLGDAAATAGRLPAVGSDLRAPLDRAAAGVDEILAAANAQVAAVENLGLITAVVVFLAPVGLWLAVWLPRRVRFIRNAAAGAALVDSSADLDLFALRAMARLPLATLARVSDDPVRAWRDGDRQVIDALADLALADEGLRRPAGLPQPHATR